MKSPKKILLLIAGIISVIAVVSGGIFLVNMGKYKATVRDMTFSGIDITRVPDGTYEGDFDAGFVYAKVRVAVKNGIMTDVKLLEHKNGKGASAETIIHTIVEKQTTDVDSVSGATSSSKVIRKAVENALLKQ